MQKQIRSKKKRIEWWKVFQVVNIILILLLGVFVYIQNERINKLSKGSLRNDILVSSVIEDTTQDLGKAVTIPIKIDSNFEGKIPVYIELDSVIKKGKKINFNYEHLWVSKQEANIGESDSFIFNSNITTKQRGEYHFIFKIYYNYNIDVGFEDGETEMKDYSLSIFFE